MNIADEIIAILVAFGGGKGGEPGHVIVRFLLPAFFWSLLAWIAFHEWGKDREKKDLYIGIASITGLVRELLMFASEYGSLRGLVSFGFMYNYYPPMEHAATMLSSAVIGYAFYDYLFARMRQARIFLSLSLSATIVLYLVTAFTWPAFLRQNPNVSFGMFWGDMAFRIVATGLLGCLLGVFAAARSRGRHVPGALLFGIAFLFLDEFLMIFNIATAEQHVSVYAPIRHNLHIWAIPFFLATYWADIHRRLTAAEEQMRQSQKMEAIGTLAGGVAHDFNNLLTVIQGYSDMLLTALPEEQPARAMVEPISAAGKRAAELTGHLLAYSRRQILRMEPVDISAVVNGVAKLLQRLMREDVILEIHAAESAGSVTADSGQIEQVIINLAVNARDAMPDGGLLIIETAEVELDGSYAEAHPGVNPGPYMVISVSDTGRGMTPDVREKIFEPFFTTKDIGEGTGLGLSTVYGIVKQHNGHINVYSEPGKGTTFRAYLPRSGGKVAERRAEAPSRPVKGSGVVLVVDDEELVREMIGDTLRHLGYTILEASDGREAITLCDSFEGKIDLLLTDVVMPHMNGKELAKALLAKRPGTRVVFMSGYTENVIAHHGVLDTGVVFLQKPMRIAELARTVNEALVKDDAGKVD